MLVVLPSLRRALLGVAALVLTFVALGQPVAAVTRPTATTASPCRGQFTIYYSDSTKTKVVGRYTLNCVTRACTGSGTVTSFFDAGATTCAPSPGGVN